MTQSELPSESSDDDTLPRDQLPENKLPGNKLPYDTTRESGRVADGGPDARDRLPNDRLPNDRLPNAPARPSAHAASDLELIRLWLSGKSRHTRRAYEADLEEFVGRADKPLQAVLLGDVQEHKGYLLDKGLAVSTVSRKIACIKSLFTFAHKIGYVAFNVGQAARQPVARRRLNGRRAAASRQLPSSGAGKAGRSPEAPSTAWSPKPRKKQVLRASR